MKITQRTHPLHGVHSRTMDAASDRSTGTTQRRRVLVVDDDDSLLDALDRALTEADYEVVAAARFEDARRHLTREKFDVLLTDIRLGAFNGLQLAVLAKDLNPDIRLIVFSGFDDTVLRDEVANLGATYLVKPVAFARLSELMQGRT